MELTLSKQQSDFLGRFLYLAIVNICSTIMVPLAGLISVGFLGHLSDIHQLVGVALASVLFNCIYAVLYFVRMSTTGVTAQAVGRNDHEEVLLTGLRNGLIALGLGLLILLLQYPLGEIGFALLGGTAADKAPACEYFSARIWGAPAVLLNYVLIGWFMGQENNGKVLVISFIGNAANVILNYLLIVQWHWGSAGAGLSEAVSQFLMLFVGLIYLCFHIKWQDVTAVAGKVLQPAAFKSTFALNGNIFIGMVVTISCFNIFQDLSSSLGTTVFAQNALMMQIVLLTAYILEGIGYATETLGGNFKGKGENEQLISLAGIAAATSMLVGMSIAIVCVFFPNTVFGLLTNHTEVTDKISLYIQWLLPVLGFSSIAFMLDGYFLGLAEGNTFRNVNLVSTVMGFVPIAVAAFYLHSNHLLWLSLAVLMLLRALIYGTQLPRTFSSDTEEGSVSPTVVEAESQVL